MVVTGAGAISPYGAGVDALWSGLLAGHVVTGELDSGSLPPLQSPRGAAVPVEALRSTTDGAEARCTTFARQAAREAVAAASLPSGARGAAWLLAGTVMGPRAASERPFEATPVASEDVASLATSVGEALELGGPNLVVGNACAGGNTAVGEGAAAIARGEADVCVAGGAEQLSATVVTMFRRLRSEASSQVRPFDVRRDGVLLGEGAAFVVLESLDHARRRGARILAEVVGWSNVADAHHLTAPHPQGRGARRAMVGALGVAGLAPADVDVLCAHGTGTAQNDVVEGRAAAAVFGHRLPLVTSVKGSVGHLQGAASALDAVVCVSALHHSAVPPAPTSTDPDPECRVEPLTQAMYGPVEVVLSNSFGFGGNVACVVYARYR